MAEEAAPPQRLMGVVKSFKQNWGFLTVEGLDGDVLMHLGDNPGLGRAPSPGDSVEFDLVNRDGKHRAMNARSFTEGVTSHGHVGSVVSFFDGWGLIESPDVEGKLYCGSRDNPQLRDNPPMPGDEVSFDVGTNPRKEGRPMAVNVTLKVRSQSEVEGCRVPGRVHSFNNGWGFAVSRRFSGTVLLGKTNVAAAGLGHLQVGDDILFDLVASPQGKYEAVNIAPVMLAAGAGGHGSPWAAGALPPFMAAARRGLALPRPGGMLDAGARERSRTPAGHGGPAGVTGETVCRTSGTIKTFRHGWGFVTCNEAQGDVYLSEQHSPALAGAWLTPGDVVEFDLVQRGEGSGRNNGATAINAVLVPKSLSAQPPPPAGPRPQQQRFMPQTSALPQSGMSWGTVVSMREGWGFIRLADGESDVFFGLRDNAHLPNPPMVGDQVCFTQEMGQKGRLRAINISIENGPLPNGQLWPANGPMPTNGSTPMSGPPSQAGERVQGAVTVVESAGFAWAVSDALGPGERIMLGKRHLDKSGMQAASLQVGERLEFELSMTPKGYEAVKISRLDALF